jgi:hypothetical protein
MGAGAFEPRHAGRERHGNLLTDRPLAISPIETTDITIPRSRRS